MEKINTVREESKLLGGSKRDAAREWASEIMGDSDELLKTVVLYCLRIEDVLQLAYIFQAKKDIDTVYEKMAKRRLFVDGVIESAIRKGIYRFGEVKEDVLLYATKILAMELVVEFPGE